MAPSKLLPDSKTIIDCWFKNAGNKTATARELGIDKGTVIRRLEEAKLSDKNIAGGRVTWMPYVYKSLPKAGKIKRYIVTSAQNNTKVHKQFWENLKAYAEWVEAEIMVVAFSYNKAAYAQARAVVPGRGPTVADRAKLWYDPEVEPYLVNLGPHETRGYELAKGLLLCGEVDILPTAARPLDQFDGYCQASSGIFPHAKMAMRSIATSKGQNTKYNYTTGTCTQSNYVERSTGQKAAFHHVYGAVIAEVDEDGNWWVRQINASKNGAFDECPSCANGVIRVDKGEITDGHRVEGITFGDVHASEIDKDVEECNWGKDGWNGDLSIIDALDPKYQFLHDLFSMRSRSHHDNKSARKKLQRWAESQFAGNKTADSVEEEVKETARVLKKSHRASVRTIVVNSNHDRHGDRWVEESDWKLDPVNAQYLLRAQQAMVESILSSAARGTESEWQFHEWALKNEGGSFAHFLQRDESFTICGNIECGIHGDEGPNGSKGSTRAYTHMDVRVNKGHDHTAAIVDGVYSAGACARSYSYQHGPSNHSVSHIVTYQNGKRAIITYRNGRWRA